MSLIKYLKYTLNLLRKWSKIWPSQSAQISHLGRPSKQGREESKLAIKDQILLVQVSKPLEGKIGPIGWKMASFHWYTWPNLHHIIGRQLKSFLETFFQPYEALILCKWEGRKRKKKREKREKRKQEGRLANWVNLGWNWSFCFFKGKSMNL